VLLPTEASARQPVLALPDITGVQCVLVRNDDDFSQVDDLAAYLRHGGAQVTVASSAEAGQRVAEELERPVVLVEWMQPGDDRGGGVPHDDGIHHLRITHGQRRTPRVLAPNLLALDQVAIREPSLVRAVAIAAGRAAPDTFRDEREQPVVDPHAKPVSVSEARRLGSLILVAEDDEINQKVILRQLDLLGHAAEVASDGVEALAMWRRGRYAMLITDLHMPEMDGYALTAAIRREESPMQRLPIVALTANALRGEESRAKAAGMDEYLTKPIRLKDLKRALTHWLHLDEPASFTAASDTVEFGATNGGAASGAPARRSTPRPAVPPGGVSTPTGNEAVAENGLIETVLDLEVLKRYVGDEPELVQEFLVSFREAAHQYLGRLTTAMGRADFATVANTAHTFKSSARAVGALALGDLCAEVESGAMRHDVEGLNRHLAVFAGELAKVDARLDQLLIPKS
jgi:CheY-like chemotaxis protein/HPt (histidine-containing phosphotransfer) domain-containing protein